MEGVAATDVADVSGDSLTSGGKCQLLRSASVEEACFEESMAGESQPGLKTLISLSMMARVSLGHSGRIIHKPPSNLTYALALLISGVIFRVFFPLLWPEEYLTWIALAQVFWILAFGIFLLLYYPILTRPRIDGLPG